MTVTDVKINKETDTDWDIGTCSAVHGHTYPVMNISFLLGTCKSTTISACRCYVYKYYSVIY